MQRVFSAIESVGILLEPRPRAADDAQRCLMKLIIAEEKQRREELEKKGIRNNFGRNLRLLNGHVFEEHLLQKPSSILKEKHFLKYENYEFWKFSKFWNDSISIRNHCSKINCAPFLFRRKLDLKILSEK